MSEKKKEKKSDERNLERKMGTKVRKCHIKWLQWYFEKSVVICMCVFQLSGSFKSCDSVSQAIMKWRVFSAWRSVFDVFLFRLLDIVPDTVLQNAPILIVNVLPLRKVLLKITNDLKISFQLCFKFNTTFTYYNNWKRQQAGRVVDKVIFQEVTIK